VGLLTLIAMAGAIGLVCHWATSRFGRTRGIADLVVVSAASSLITAWFFFLINYVKLGDVPEPPGVPIFIAILSFPVSLAAGIPFLLRYRDKYGRCKNCGRSLAGKTSGPCPECGDPIGSGEEEPRADRPPLEGRLAKTVAMATRNSFSLVVLFWLFIALVALLIGTCLS